jgi:hypothetical protein
MPQHRIGIILVIDMPDDNQYMTIDGLDNITVAVGKLRTLILRAERSGSGIIPKNTLLPSLLSIPTAKVTTIDAPDIDDWKDSGWKPT